MKFDDSFLAEVGLSTMPAEQKQDFLSYVKEEVEVMIGQRIAKGLTEYQLNEFDQIVDQNEAIKWLETNRPDYREIVTRVISEIKNEIRANRSQLLI